MTDCKHTDLNRLDQYSEEKDWDTWFCVVCGKHFMVNLSGNLSG